MQVSILLTLMLSGPRTEVHSLILSNVQASKDQGVLVHCNC